MPAAVKACCSGAMQDSASRDLPAESSERQTRSASSFVLAAPLHGQDGTSRDVHQLSLSRHARLLRSSQGFAQHSTKLQSMWAWKAMVGRWLHANLMTESLAPRVMSPE